MAKKHFNKRIVIFFVFLIFLISSVYADNWNDNLAHHDTLYSNVLTSKNPAGVDPDGIRVTVADAEGFEVTRDAYFATALGNVGIGTTAPSGKLHVSAETSGDAYVYIEADTDDNNENDNPAIIMRQDGGVSYATMGVVGDPGQIYTGSLVNAAYFGNKNGQEVQFIQNNIARMTIGPSGNVGIGTVSPNERLHVAGDLKIVSDSDVTSALGTGAIYTQNTAGTLGLHIDTNEIQTVGGTLHLQNEGIQDLNVGNGDLFVETGLGRVGIGITNPSYPLHLGATHSTATSTRGASFTLTDDSDTYATPISKWALYSLYQKTGSANQVSYANSAAWHQSNINAGTLGTLYNVNSRVQVPTGGAITTLRHFVADADYSDDGGTIGSSTGFHVNDIAHAGLTNQYGLYVNSLTSATNNYAIYTAGTTPSRFGGDVTIIGKLNAPGGVDPPYISFSNETHESIRKYAKDVGEHEIVMEFWNGEAHRKEIYVINEDKFYTITGELIEEEKQYMVN